MKRILRPFIQNMDLVDRRFDMKVYNVFFSPTGGTKKAADELVRAWNGDATVI